MRLHIVQDIREAKLSIKVLFAEAIQERLRTAIIQKVLIVHQESDTHQAMNLRKLQQMKFKAMI